MGIVVLGAVFVDIKGYPSDVYIPGGRNAGRVEQMHGAYDFIATMEDPNCEWMFLVFVLALFAVSLKLVRVGSRSDRYIDGGEGPLFFG